MVKAKVLAGFLSRELKHKHISDRSKNGLQYDSGREIGKVGLAVDGCIEVFDIAQKKKCDILIVHHGIKWKKNYVKQDKQRLSHLRNIELSLFASHLPLDCNEKYGNNIEIARILGLSKIKKFGNYHGKKIGFKGELSEDIMFDDLVKMVDGLLGVKSLKWDFGKKKVKSIGIVSGGGADAIEDAAKEVDVLLTGEAGHSNYHTAKEVKVNVIAAGHYATERYGVLAIGNLLKERYDVEVEFIDVPTGL